MNFYQNNASFNRFITVHLIKLWFIIKAKMVLTRSGCTPTKPLTPIGQRKKRSKSRVSHANSNDVPELNATRTSLAERLESISEENEKGFLDGSKKKVNKIAVKKVQLIEESAIENPQPSQSEIITEEMEDDKDTEMTPECSQKSTEQQTSNTKNENFKNKVSEMKKHKFYFPPAKSLVPPHVKPMGIDVGMEIQETYIDVKCSKNGKKKIESLCSEEVMNKKDSQLKDSVITPDFEKKLAIPSEKSLSQQRKERKMIREESTGKNWFNMKPPEMTDEVKRDLNILQMRSVLDPKRFYKHNDRKALPRYFQIGKIMDSPADFYSSRVPKKQRKQNLTEDLLADAEFQQYQKRKYNEIQMKKRALGGKRRKTKHEKFSKRRKETA